MGTDGFKVNTMFLTDSNGKTIKFSDCVRVVLESEEFIDEKQDEPIIRFNEPSSISFTCKLSFRNRVKIFGFWRTVKNLFKRRK